MRAGIKWNRVVVLALCIAVPSIWAAAIRGNARGIMKAVDFGGIYWGARCALRHVDPYNTGACIREFEAEGGQLPGVNGAERNKNVFVLMLIYPPTALLAVLPFAMLPWSIAHTAWIGLITELMVLGVFLAWDLVPASPVMAGCMAGFIVLNCLVPLVTGNPVGMVVPLCVISAWCFLRERYVPSGVVLLAVSLVIKPHDAGLIWLYFLLAGGAGRRRALQTLVVAAALGICAAIWIAPSSPNWVHEMNGNLKLIAVRGGPSDPGPTGLDERGFSPIISMQNAASVFWGDPHFYNPASYAIGGGLIMAWIVAVLRKSASRQGALLALAAISILTLLPVYHRAEDAKLLLLSIPACAMLWAEKGALRWVALALTSAAILVTSDIPIVALVSATGKMAVSTSTLGGKLTLLALQPQPLVLLAAGCFYLWVYIRYEPEGAGRETAAEKWLDAAIAE
jgi:hypothetical protein